MSKIICDVCGTSYPETAAQCPICGCVRSGDSVTIAGDTNEATVQTPSSHTYVKGGRFSKANVKKRNSGKPIYSAEASQKALHKEKPLRDVPVESKKQGKGLIIALAVFALAVVAIAVCIATGAFSTESPNETGSNTTIAQTENTTNSTAQEGSKVKITLSSDLVMMFAAAGETDQIIVKLEPDNTTEEITYSSNNKSVATVDANGLVTAIGNGQANITVTCGGESVECFVECQFTNTEDATQGTENAPTENTVTTPTQDTTVEPTQGTETEPTQGTETTPSTPSATYTEDDLQFVDNGFGYEYSIPTSQGSFNPYNGNIPAELVTFTSSNESIGTVSADGTVTFLKAGMFEVTAKYGEFEIKCIFRIY